MVSTSLPDRIRPAAALVLMLLAGAPWAVAQAKPSAPPELKLYSYTMEHRVAADALSRVEALLSSDGRVELRAEENSLAIRDRQEILFKVAAMLRAFDRPPEPVKVEVYLVEASRIAYSPSLIDGELPPKLLGHLRKQLPYSSFRVMAQTELHSLEGEEVTYEMGEGYGVQFRLGTIVDPKRIRLHDFRISRWTARGGNQALMHTSLNLQLSHTTFLALAPEESSAKAMMVILTPVAEGAAAARLHSARWAEREP